jgi:hypothetical protein
MKVMKRYTDAEKIAAFDEVLAMLHESHDHHEYTGWGDTWERECAGKGGTNLIRRMSAVIEKYPLEEE